MYRGKRLRKYKNQFTIKDAKKEFLQDAENQKLKTSRSNTKKVKNNRLKSRFG